MRVKVGDKVIPASFLKIEGKRTLVGAKDWEERDRKKNWNAEQRIQGSGKRKLSKDWIPGYR